MATPIQYVPQFIPTNVGLMNQQLGQMQQRYDQAAAMMPQFEDQYGQMLVDPSDIEGKNAILGKFQGKVQDIVDRYGGDYGAASKEIARNISRFRQDPFFQLVPYKRALAEEERRKASQLGVFGITTKSVSDTPAYDPKTGQYASKEDLAYEVLDRRDLEQEWSRQYKDLGDDFEEYKLSESDIPGYHKIAKRIGLDPNKVNEVAQDSFNYLKSLHPNIPDDVAASIASNMTEGLVKGTEYNYMRDLDYDPSSSKSNPNNPSSGSPLTYRLSGAEADESVRKAEKEFNTFNEALQNYNRLTKTYSENEGIGGQVKYLSESFRDFYPAANNRSTQEISRLLNEKTMYQNQKQAMVDLYNKFYPDDKENVIFDSNGEPSDIVGTRRNFVARRLNSIIDSDPKVAAEKAYNNAFSKFKDNPTYNDLTVNYGVDPSDAARYVTEEKKAMYTSHFRYDKPTDRDVDNKIYNDYAINIKNISKAYDQDGEELDNDDIKNLLPKIKNNIIASEFNLMKGTINITGKDGDEIKAIEIPIDDIGNETMRKGAKYYKSFLDDLYSQSSTKESTFIAPDGMSGYSFTSAYNPSTGSYDKVLNYRWKDGDNVKQYTFNSFDEGLSHFAENAAQTLIDNYGTQVEYKTRKR